MGHRWTTILGLVCASAGAVCWAIGLAVLQPGTEPAKPWHDMIAGNNMYWARDLRWMALVTVLVALVTVARGNPVRSGVVVGGMAGWLALDLYLDRIDVAGPTAAFRLAMGACAVLAVAVGALAWRVRPTRADRRILTFAAILVAAVAPLAGSLESTTDTEPGLTPSAFVVGAILALVALGAGLAAAPTLSRYRLLAVLGAVVPAGVGLVLLRLIAPGDRFPMLVAFAGLLFATVTMLRRRPPESVSGGVFGFLGLAVSASVAYAVLTIIVTLFGTIALAQAATAYVGNPPMVDEDVLLSAAGVIVGLIFGGVSMAASGIQRTLYTWVPYSG